MTGAVTKEKRVLPRPTAAFPSPRRSRADREEPTGLAGAAQSAQRSQNQPLLAVIVIVFSSLKLHTASLTVSFNIPRDRARTRPS